MLRALNKEASHKSNNDCNLPMGTIRINDSNSSIHHTLKFLNLYPMAPKKYDQQSSSLVDRYGINMRQGDPRIRVAFNLEFNEHHGDIRNTSHFVCLHRGLVFTMNPLVQISNSSIMNMNDVNSSHSIFVLGPSSYGEFLEKKQWFLLFILLLFW